jgi:outer membrane protein TolC
MLLGSAQAGTVVLDLPQSIERALHSDPRITEKEKLAEAARALLQEAEGAEDWIFDVNTLVGLAPTVKGGLTTDADGNMVIPDDALEMDGVSPWYYLEMAVIKPLYTFGKVENYALAAKGNIEIKEGDIALQRSEVVLQVTQAYNGYLAAHDTRLLLEDALQKMRGALSLVEGWLEDGEGEVKQSDLYALQTGEALLQRYIAEAAGIEKIALAGLRMLTDIDDNDQLELADKRLAPAPLPEAALDELQAQALEQRPEIRQLSAGLEARRALMMAKRSESYPNVYAGVVGGISYAPGREDLSRITPYDPFDYAGATPVVGLKWDWASGRQPAQVNKARAELESTLALKSFAQKGIPFQVEEQYRNHEMVERLYDASRSSRRWMISTYADFEAGVEEAEKIITAMLSYIQSYSDYIRKVNDYNMHVARLRVVTGEVQ